MLMLLCGVEIHLMIIQGAFRDSTDVVSFNQITLRQNDLLQLRFMSYFSLVSLGLALRRLRHFSLKNFFISSHVKYFLKSVDDGEINKIVPMKLYGGAETWKFMFNNNFVNTFDNFYIIWCRESLRLEERKKLKANWIFSF